MNIPGLGASLHGGLKAQLIGVRQLNRMHAIVCFVCNHRGIYLTDTEGPWNGRRTILDYFQPERKNIVFALGLSFIMNDTKSIGLRRVNFNQDQPSYRIT